MKKIIKALGSVMILVMMAVALSTTGSATAVINNEAEEHILNELRRANIPNSSIAVIQDSETSYIFRNSTYDTLFQIGSITKSFTGFGVLLLEEKGLLSVTDPVNQHLPWFEVNYNGVHVSNESITIYTLLQHTSGFTSDERLFRQAAVTETTDEFITRLVGLELEFYPSTTHVYGNMNYIILGLLIEAASGQSYDEFMTQHVLHPLGLYSTFTNMQRAYETGRVIGGNRLRFLHPLSWNPPKHPTTIPTGFIYSNIVDMARWAGIHLGTVDITEQFARVVQRSHENNHDFTNPFADMDFIYAAGWGIDFETGSISHYGATAGYSSAIRMLSHNDTAVVVLGNLQQGAIPFGNLVLDTIEGQPFSSVGMDIFTIIDIICTVSIAGIVIYIGFFIRFVVRVTKGLHNGEIANRKLTFKKRWLIVPLIVIADLIYTYISPSMIANTSHEFAIMYSPASLTPTIIALWVMLVCSLCVFFARIFGFSPIIKRKTEI